MSDTDGEGVSHSQSQIQTEATADEVIDLKNWKEAEKIVGLGTLKINNPLSWNRDKYPTMPLFNEKDFIPLPYFWLYLFTQHGSFSRATLERLGQFFERDETHEGIKLVHDHLIHPATNENNSWHTNTMVYPLLQSLMANPSSDTSELLQQWQIEWMKDVDPAKLEMALGIYFSVLSRYPLDSQKKHFLGLRDKPLAPEEATFLANIFRDIVARSTDTQLLAEADRRNRTYAANANSQVLTTQDLFHMTDLEFAPEIVRRGLLATECLSLTSDWGREAFCAMSFYAMREQPHNLQSVLDNLASGAKTYRVHDKAMYFAFTKPTVYTDPDYLAYPPDSYFMSGTKSDKVVTRYVNGYDSSGSGDPHKDCVYALIGMPSPAITFAAIRPEQQAEYAEKASQFPFYVPAYSYDGDLLYSMNQYDATRTPLRM